MLDCGNDYVCLRPHIAAIEEYYKRMYENANAYGVPISREIASLQLNDQFYAGGLVGYVNFGTSNCEGYTFDQCVSGYENRFVDQEVLAGHIDTAIGALDIGFFYDGNGNLTAINNAVAITNGYHDVAGYVAANGLTAVDAGEVARVLKWGGSVLSVGGQVVTELASDDGVTLRDVVVIGGTVGGGVYGASQGAVICGGPETLLGVGCGITMGYLGGTAGGAGAGLAYDFATFNWLNDGNPLDDE